MTDNKQPMHSPKTPLECENKVMQSLREQLAQQKQILRCIRTVLPAVFAEQIQHCLIREHKLVVYTHSQSWATQLRFQRQAMLDAIEPLTTTVTEIQIRVLPSDNAAMQPKQQATLPSLTTIENMRKDSLAMPDNEIKQALLSLSATLARLAKENQDTGRGD